MTQFEMAENISEKCNVTLEEAKSALEAGDWNMLTAAQQIEVDKVRRLQELEAVASGCEAATAQAVAEEAAVEEQVEATEKIEETAQAENGERRRKLGGLGARIRRLVACGNRNRFVVRRGDARVLDVPVTVLAIFALAAFWPCLLVLAIGLFAGCRYGFNGRELGREGINDALGRVADTAERVKKAVVEA